MSACRHESVSVCRQKEVKNIKNPYQCASFVIFFERRGSQELEEAFEGYLHGRNRTILAMSLRTVSKVFKVKSISLWEVFRHKENRMEQCASSAVNPIAKRG
jgi:hypothetical protein